jgi:hypothetical protein
MWVRIRPESRGLSPRVGKQIDKANPPEGTPFEIPLFHAEKQDIDASPSLVLKYILVKRSD